MGEIIAAPPQALIQPPEKLARLSRAWGKPIWCITCRRLRCGAGRNCKVSQNRLLAQFNIETQLINNLKSAHIFFFAAIGYATHCLDTHHLVLLLLPSRCLFAPSRTGHWWILEC